MGVVVVIVKVDDCWLLLVRHGIWWDLWGLDTIAVISSWLIDRLMRESKKVKVKYTDIVVRSLTCHIAVGTHMPYRIIQCYLPPDRGDNSYGRCSSAVPWRQLHIAVYLGTCKKQGSHRYQTFLQVLCCMEQTMIGHIFSAKCTCSTVSCATL